MKLILWDMTLLLDFLLEAINLAIFISRPLKNHMTLQKANKYDDLGDSIF